MFRPAIKVKYPIKSGIDMKHRTPETQFIADTIRSDTAMREAIRQRHGRSARHLPVATLQSTIEEICLMPTEEPVTFADLL